LGIANVAFFLFHPIFFSKNQGNVETSRQQSTIQQFTFSTFQPSNILTSNKSYNFGKITMHA